MTFSYVYGAPETDDYSYSEKELTIDASVKIEGSPACKFTKREILVSEVLYTGDAITIDLDGRLHFKTNNVDGTTIDFQVAAYNDE